MRRFSAAALAIVCSIAAAHAAPLRVGEDVIQRTDTPHPYAAAEAGSAGPVWAKQFSFPGASYIAVHFSRFHLAPGDVVIVRSPYGRDEWKYEGLGRGDLGESEGGFWATHIRGDTAIVELFGRTGGEYGFTIDRYARGYTEEEMNPESICGTNDAGWAKCYESSEPTIYERGRTVARLLIQGSGLCSGWLIGSAGHLITNHHCILTAADALNTDYEFNAEGASCATNCSAQLSCPGTIEATTATLIQTDVPLDYSLVLLPSNITPTYGYLRLRNPGPAVVNERMYILGHPGGKGKTFSVASTDPSDASGYCEVLNLTEDPSVACIPQATQLDVGYMCDTEGGSSGSAVLGYSDHKVIALHHCGGCPNSGVQITNVVTSLGPNVPPGAIFDPVGVVILDANSYSCSDSVGIEVRDDNLIGAGTQAVAIRSTTEATAENVVLTETPAGSGKFLGSIPTTSGAVVNGDGLLSVAHGDTITVTYQDLDDGTGSPATRTDSAGADCVPPVITNVQAINVTGNSADVIFNTDEGSNTVATYGLAASPPPTSTASNPAIVTSHSVRLGGLLPCRGYIFSVSATDAAGNVAADNNGGVYFGFDTGQNVNPTYPSPSPPVAIPDNTTVLATVNVPDVNTVLDVNVKINITHTYDGDLDIFLIGPNGTRVELTTDNGGTGENFLDTIFDDEAATPITSSSATAPFAGSYRPEGSLATLDGINSAGTWRLEVTDDAGSDTGTINAFELILTYPAQACGPHLKYKSHSVADACNGTGGGGGNGLAEPGETLTLPVVIENDGTSPTTGVSASLSSPTPGVTITTGTSAFPDLAAGQSAPGATPFAIQVDPSVACGTILQLNVGCAANEGSWSGGSFSIPVGSLSGTQTLTVNSADVPKPLADPGTVTSQLSVASTETVLDVNVGLTLTHTYTPDLILTLISPGGTRIKLSDQRPRSFSTTPQNYTGTTFDDEAATPISSGSAPFSGSFRPEAPLSSIDGTVAGGTWRLEIQDLFPIDTGSLGAWSVILTTTAPPVCNTCTPAPPVPPGEVLDLQAPDKQTFQWSSAVGADAYSLVRGLLGGLPVGPGAGDETCVEPGLSGTTATDLTVPDQLSGGFWYLVRAGNAGGWGPWGNEHVNPGPPHNGPARATSTCP